MNRFGRIPPSGMVYQAPMPQPLAPEKSPAIGSRKNLPTRAAAGGTVDFDINTTVSLVEVRALEWGPWAITLDPMYPGSVSPWPATQLSVTGRPRVCITWGVGGFRRTVEFDYPFGGTVFVLNGQNIDIGVRPTVADNHGAGVVVPTVGAWAVPAAAAGSETPLLLQEADSLNVAQVPPFARYLNVAPYNGGVALAPGATVVRFTDPTTLVTEAEFVNGYTATSPSHLRVPVPPQATRVEIGDTAAPNWSVFWEISLA